MRCPVDGTELRMTDRQGVEIDYCPQCRGIWLDRSELDKILEREAREAAPEPRRPAPPPRDRYAHQPADHHPQRYDPRAQHGYHDHDDRKYYKKRKKKKSLLSEIFDFD